MRQKHTAPIISGAQPDRQRSTFMLKIAALVTALSVTITLAVPYQVNTAQAVGSIKAVSVSQNAPLAAPKAQLKSVQTGKQTFKVSTVTIPKGYRVSSTFGKQQYGTSAGLGAIVKANQAVAAINGTFFEAYTGVPEPWGTLIINGKIEHVGNTGTIIGFDRQGNVLMDTLRIQITGTVESKATGKKNNWYTYFVNRTPAKDGSSAVLYTPMRGKNIGFTYGKAVVVEQGIVKEVAAGKNVAIPANGFVLVYTGKEKRMADRFAVGDLVDVQTKYTNTAGNQLDWSEVQTAIGAGPRLVKDGRIALNPAQEGFKQDKILSLSATRSGIGVMPDGSVMLATVPSATMSQWAAIWKQLGAKQAMNLDGGASSGLYANGKMMTEPGRALSNALLFRKP
ncbi:phosphodiester glycosidase family protein [Paenibacillus sp. ACRRX]|uniref:phosphodiester glycosidase family protein n=1 Tax=Paenibacillus sp. ACRRX TaxID=2918206 RepID=UPI001EF6BB2B|nr:phosphodiester glycosidase family protein [Paenibacillus sp. ACRRX]MCG7409832.1 phosphodiester glycosidase family protein [Paenibacillus sp. ACRRX]